MITDDMDGERIRLVEADLAQTNEFIKGVLTTGAALRTSAITIWLALLGFAVQQNLPELGGLAALTTAAFWLADGYHGWLYTEASKHARSVEALLSEYFNLLSRYKSDPSLLTTFRARLRATRLGLFVNFHSPFGLGKVWGARPKLFYRFLYPALLVIAIAIWPAVDSGWIGKPPAQPAHVIVDHVPGRAMHAR